MKYAKDYKCCECKTEQAVTFFPVCDPDIPSYPYCKKCLDKVKVKLLIELNKIDKQYESKNKF